MKIESGCLAIITAPQSVYCGKTCKVLRFYGFFLDNGDDNWAVNVDGIDYPPGYFFIAREIYLMRIDGFSEDIKNKTELLKNG